jgi:tetratricopeptide (TPR) repeat protein
MTTQKEAYQQALSFIHNGELEKARELLGRLLKADRNNVDYWLWLSAVVKTTKERVYCLREVLALDPENEDASLGLRMVGEKALEADPAHHIPLEQVPWKTRLETADEHPITHRGMRSRVALFTLLGIAVFALFGFGVYMAFNPVKPANTAPIKKWTFTPQPTATETATPGPTITGFAPLVLPSNITVTPTILYVATPHNRMEAYNAAMRAYEKGNWTSAIDYFKQVLVDEPNSPDIYYHLGDIYRFEGKYKEAASAYQSAIKIDPSFAPAYLGKGRTLLESTPSKPEDAIAAFQQAIAKDPQMAEAYLEMAKSNLVLNDASSALGWLDKFVQNAPDNAISTMYRAEAYLMQGQSDKALSEVEKANQLDPTSIAIYKTWAETLQAVGQYKESIPLLLTVLQSNPLDLDSEALMARAYYEIGDTEKALTLVSTALQQDSKNIEAYLLRADIYLEQGMLEESNADFNAVLRIDYNDFDGNIGLGRVFLAQSLAGAAFNKFDYTEKLATSDTQKAILIYWKAKALQGLDEVSAAIKNFNAALEYPGVVLPKNLREDALAQLNSLYTPTPTLKPTQTTRPSLTPTITKTPKATATTKATVTPTATKAITATPTP